MTNLTTNNNDAIMHASVKVKKLTKTAIIPTYGTKNSAGADLYADISGRTMIPPHATLMIKTGIALEIEESFVGLIYARSGIASKRGLAPANKVGVIDSDYRGEIMVALHNHTNDAQFIDPGERIAQIVFTKYFIGSLEEVEDFETETERGEGGFGSTGTK